MKHVLSLTKKWTDMAKIINDDVLLWKLSDGDVAAKELYYHKPEVKACLQSFRGQYDQALRKSERTTDDGNNDTHWIKVNALNIVYSFMFEEKCQGAEVFYAKDLEKIYLGILSEHGIQYEFHISRFAPYWFQIMMILKSIIWVQRSQYVSLRALIEFSKI